MSNSEGIIFQDTSEDEPVSAAAHELADDLIPVIAQADFQSDIMRLIVGIFSSHFQQVRNNVARALHKHDLEAQLLRGDIEALRAQLSEALNHNRTLRRELRRQKQLED